MSTTTIEIPTWANGPGDPRAGTGTGNGGWTAGLLAGHVTGAAGGCAVDLRVMPPLGRALRVEVAQEGAEARLLDDDAPGAASSEPVLVAQAQRAVVEVDVPLAVRAIGVEAAREASAGFAFRDEHPFPHCVSCGTDRAPGDVWLHLHCGPVAGVEVVDDAGDRAQVVADVWQPDTEVADAADPAHASTASCWSALDCPSAAPFADPHAEHPSVLARIAVRLDSPVLVGEPYVAAAWLQSVEGRKRRSASVLLDAAGAVVGVAQALWIEVRPR